MKEFIKKLIPSSLLKFLRPVYHGSMALVGSYWYGRPSGKMVVVGVTGTNGKTTTVNLIAKILQAAGYKVGYTSTATINFGGQEIYNTYKMTMPSGWLLHKWMRQMLDAGCQYAVLEVSSEGLAQNRHLGIHFDIAVFTNLTPEHIESHGGFENYKKAKGRLFEALNKFKINNEKLKICPGLKKTIVTNADSEHGRYYSSFPAGKYVSYGVQNSSDFQASDVSFSPSGVSYKLQATSYNLSLKGQFDVYNSLAAIAVAQSVGLSAAVCKRGLESVSVVPGRMEVLLSKPYCAVVDYAYEPEEMKQLYETVSRWPHKRVIQVLGPTGGGRDKARIPTLGNMAGKFAGLTIITTDDPYDDDPAVLAKAMAEGVRQAGRVQDRDFWVILDRRAAIARALSLAQPGDLVLVTGKGADQKMALANGKYVEWDDRKVVLEELDSLRIY